MMLDDLQLLESPLIEFRISHCAISVWPLKFALIHFVEHYWIDFQFKKGSFFFSPNNPANSSGFFSNGHLLVLLWKALLSKRQSRVSMSDAKQKVYIVFKIVNFINSLSWSSVVSSYFWMKFKFSFQRPLLLRFPLEMWPGSSSPHERDQSLVENLSSG